jgi:hypothetical protein
MSVDMGFSTVAQTCSEALILIQGRDVDLGTGE